MSYALHIQTFIHAKFNILESRMLLWWWRIENCGSTEKFQKPQGNLSFMIGLKSLWHWHRHPSLAVSSFSCFRQLHTSRGYHHPGSPEPAKVFYISDLNQSKPEPLLDLCFWRGHALNAPEGRTGSLAERSNPTPAFRNIWVPAKLFRMAYSP